MLKQGTKHYIAMSGEHGCLPDHCAAYDTAGDAIEDLCQLFELGRRRRQELRQNWILELSPRDGSEYCEVVLCDCPEGLSAHNDDGGSSC